MSAVQEANRRYEQGIKPKMVMDPLGNLNFSDIVDEIFSLKDRQKSLELIDKYSKFWMQMKAGQGFSGKKTVNAHTLFDQLFEVAASDIEDDIEIDEVIEDTDDLMEEIIDYFRTQETDNIDLAVNNFDGEFSFEELKLVHLQFLSDVGN
jgi:hypothetical protein